MFLIFIFLLIYPMNGYIKAKFTLKNATGEFPWILQDIHIQTIYFQIVEEALSMYQHV